MPIRDGVLSNPGRFRKSERSLAIALDFGKLKANRTTKSEFMAKSFEIPEKHPIMPEPGRQNRDFQHKNELGQLGAARETGQNTSCVLMMMALHDNLMA